MNMKKEAYFHNPSRLRKKIDFAHGHSITCKRLVLQKKFTASRNDFLAY